MKDLIITSLIGGVVGSIIWLIFMSPGCPEPVGLESTVHPTPEGGLKVIHVPSNLEPFTFQPYRGWPIDPQDGQAHFAGGPSSIYSSDTVPLPDNDALILSSQSMAKFSYCKACGGKWLLMYYRVHEAQ